VLGKAGAIEGLAVANQHQGLAELYRGTRWGGRAGTVGVWVQSLRRLPEAMPLPKPVWIGGATLRATRIPWSLVAGRISQEALG